VYNKYKDNWTKIYDPGRTS